MDKIKYSSLNDKLILVTGATSGMGKGVCEELLSQGAKVLGIGRDVSKIEENIISNKNFIFYKYDLTNIDGIENFINGCVKTHGKLDGIVFSAGREETLPLHVYKSKKIKDLFDLNLFSGIEILRLFAKKKNNNENGSVVFMSSVMAELGQPGIIGYCSSKAAILGVVRSSSLELAKRKIRVNAVSPGVVKTPMSKQFFDTLADENISRIQSMHPLGIGNIEDVTPLVMFLLSQQSKWITGQNIKIDGGYSIQ